MRCSASQRSPERRARDAFLPLSTERKTPCSSFSGFAWRGTRLDFYSNPSHKPAAQAESSVGLLKIQEYACVVIHSLGPFATVCETASHARQGSHMHDHRPGLDRGCTQHVDFQTPSHSRHPIGKSDNAPRDRGHCTIHSPGLGGHNIAGHSVPRTSRSQRNDRDRKSHPRTHYPWCKLDSARSWTTVGAEGRCGSPSRARRAAPRKSRGSGPAQRRAASELGFLHIRHALPTAPDQPTSTRRALRCLASPRSPERHVHDAFVSRASWLFRA